MVFEVSYNTSEKSKEIYKKILWLYSDMILSYGGFGHNLDYEDIDYMEYMFTYTEDEIAYGHFAEVISKGSIIALCCEAVNLLDEESRSPKFEEKILLLLEARIIEQYKEYEVILKKILEAFMEDEDAGWESHGKGKDLFLALKDIYKEYVIGYYKEMMEKGKWEYCAVVRDSTIR